MSLFFIHCKGLYVHLKTATEKMTSLGASVNSNVDELLNEARPVLSRMTHRVKDELHDLSESGKDAMSDVKHKMEKEARHVRVTTEHFIQHEPLTSVLIAAGTGAAAALAVSWLMRSRQR